MRATSPVATAKSISTSRRVTRGLRGVTALAAGIALTAGLSACSGRSTAAGADTQKGVTDPATATVTQIPVGEPFGPAVWSIDLAQGERATVRSDRLVVVGPRRIAAWDGNGNKVWEQPLPEDADSGNIIVHSATVSLVEQPVVGQLTYDVTQYAIADGSVVATNSVTASGESAAAGSVLAFNQPDRTIVYITQDGVRHTTPAITSWQDTGDTVSASGFNVIEAPPGDTPYWTADPTWDLDSSISVGTWTSRDIGFDGESDSVGVAMISNAQGLVLVANSTEIDGRHPDYVKPVMVDATTGQKLYSIDCTVGWSGGATGETAVDSPNRTFSAAGNVVFTASEARCVVEATPKAIDDSGTVYSSGGTAYGSDGRKHETLVVQPFGGDPVVSALPDGANYPLGFMDNGLAINHDDSYDTVTANPIKND